VFFGQWNLAGARGDWSLPQQTAWNWSLVWLPPTKEVRLPPTKEVRLPPTKDRDLVSGRACEEVGAKRFSAELKCSPPSATRLGREGSILLTRAGAGDAPSPEQVNLHRSLQVCKRRDLPVRGRCLEKLGATDRHPRQALGGNPRLPQRAYLAQIGIRLSFRRRCSQ
jgi:hypothetical protein